MYMRVELKKMMKIVSTYPTCRYITVLRWRGVVVIPLTIFNGVVFINYLLTKGRYDNMLLSVL